MFLLVCNLANITSPVRATLPATAPTTPTSTSSTAPGTAAAATPAEGATTAAAADTTEAAADTAEATTTEEEEHASIFLLELQIPPLHFLRCRSGGSFQLHSMMGKCKLLHNIHHLAPACLPRVREREHRRQCGITITTHESNKITHIYFALK